ncbi:PadR family transcriptional regulator [Actinoalloteichus hymeniacidonis]|uniref:PadR family transcriptional regulator n=1 Tax=Actinoalloteichus hymeniacidonis TaxID=340345 RepID=UPI0015601F19|nr:PadR family transcriptional regulator [Actinoalloteichus hymeniacidonis]MBB5910455.1 DNA-binding PadR family transcriptional regulator [Actinoalloteichus hymeniacidonis]
MSATRLLMLGLVRSFGRTNGYQVRRELLSWNADRWGNVNPGSIYHALKQLRGNGLLRTVDEPARQSGRRSEGIYEITEDGETEFLRLLRAALIEVDDPHSGELEAAISFLPNLPAEESAALLRQRLTKLQQRRRTLAADVEQLPGWGKPAQVGELYRLWHGQTDAEIRWLRELIGRIETSAS